MQRYFGEVIKGELTLSKDDQFHLLKVMRAKVGEQFELVSTEGKVAIYEVVSIEPFNTRMVKLLDEVDPKKPYLKLYYCLSKGSKVDLVVQKATELGVDEIVLLLSEYVVIRLDKKKEEKRLDRYKLIAKEAAEQSKRVSIPLIRGVYELNLATLKKDESDVKIIAYEGETPSTKPLFDVLLNEKKADSIAALIGPEGGFSSKEVEIAKEAGFLSISLGKRILRTETAAIHMVGLISALKECQYENL